MRLCHEVPAVFQENPDNSRSKLLERLVIHSHDIVFYFIDIILKQDVVCATAQPNCQHLQYELEKLQWLETKLMKSEWLGRSLRLHKRL